MDGADAAVEQRLDRRVGMGCAARIVRIVDYAGDARIDAAQRGQIIADIVVLRPVRLGERQMRRVHIVGERRRIGIDAAQLAFPGMAVAIDQARHDNAIAGVDHLCARGIDLRRDGQNFGALDQDIAFRQVADLGVHRHDRASLDQRAARAIDRGLAVEAVHVRCGGACEARPTSRTGGGERGASLQG